VQRITTAQADCKSNCEQCGIAFTPRERSGGKPQRFCSTDCRQAFHSEARAGGSPDLRPQRAPTCSALPAVIDPPTPKSPRNAPEANSDFDWNDADAVALAEQHETAIYWNPKGDLVIRQRSWIDDDSLIFISRDSVDQFVDKLCDVVGIPSVSR
jgi:hypothetical protein